MTTHHLDRRHNGLVSSLLALALLLISGCGDSGGGGGGPPLDPTITSFTAANSPVTAGTATTLTAVFSGGTGSVSNGVGAITSGVPVSTGSLGTSTTFLLTVTNSAGATATSTLTVNVVPGPSIAAFTASRSTITRGQNTVLLYDFSGGTGSIDQGVGPVTSGGDAYVFPTQTTTYTLTVTNAAGTAVSSSVAITVAEAPAIASFSATPGKMAPGGSATLTAVFSGGVGSVDQNVGPVTSGVPVNTGPLPATRTYTLTVSNIAGATVTASTTVTVTPFAATGSMGAPRSRHTATLLQDGRVLVVGGYDGSKYLTTAELYDPVTGTFSPTGSMNEPKFGYTATLLASGKVLIAGGHTGGTGAISTAELYDPATGTFTATGSMNKGRFEHTATLLPNGMVLISGGVILAVANDRTNELYDPATGTFSYTTEGGVGALDHSATSLRDQKILLCGGMDNSNQSTTRACAIYDPATGAFTDTGPMVSQRRGHTATLLPNGKVLIAGNEFTDSFSPPVVDAELYDPLTGMCSTTGDINEGFRGSLGLVATLLTDGRVLLTGSTDPKLYDHITEEFSVIGPMVEGRSFHTATLLRNGKVLIAGGNVPYEFPPRTVFASAELYE